MYQCLHETLLIGVSGKSGEALHEGAIVLCVVVLATELHYTFSFYNASYYMTNHFTILHNTTLHYIIQSNKLH